MEQTQGNPMNDHDLLIRVDTNLTNLLRDTNAKYEALGTRISGTEAKQSIYDRTLAEFPPKEITDRFEIRMVKMEGDIRKNSDWIHDFNLRWKIILGMVIGITTTVTFVLTVILNISKILGR